LNPIYIINKTDYEVFVRCHDCDHPISNHKVPRGKGGIAIIWPKLIDKYIKRLEDGIPSILNVRMCMFCSYLFPCEVDPSLVVFS
jgi:hypothetical protein